LVRNAGGGPVADVFGDVGAAKRAAEFARAHDFIERLPHGYMTMLSSGRSEGTTLSGGQWQRVSVARSMMRSEADLFVMDEPNSGLDPPAEEDLHRRLMEFGRGTCLLVSHRLGAVQHADSIYVLDNGRVVEHGTHQSLVSRPGLYCRMFRAQVESINGVEVPK
jgi:ATP-binding cassette subfamily B protein